MTTYVSNFDKHIYVFFVMPDIWYLVLVPVVPVVLVVLLALVLVLLSAVVPPATRSRAVVDALVCIGCGFQDVSNGTSGVVVGGRVARVPVRRYNTRRFPGVRLANFRRGCGG